MKLLSAIILFIFSIHIASANEIDKLKTKAEIQKFLELRVNAQWRKYDCFETKLKPDTSLYAREHFVKLDLDNNGLTDIIIIGKYLFAVTDVGNGHYESHF